MTMNKVWNLELQILIQFHVCHPMLLTQILGWTEVIWWQKKTIEAIFADVAYETASSGNSKLYELGRQMANVIPQHPCFNQDLRGMWRSLEAVILDFVQTEVNKPENEKAIVHYGVIPGSNNLGQDFGTVSASPVKIPLAILISVELRTYGALSVRHRFIISNPEKAEEGKLTPLADTSNFEALLRAQWNSLLPTDLMPEELYDKIKEP